MEGDDQLKLSAYSELSEPAKAETEQAVTTLNNLLSDDLARRAVQSVVSYPEPAELFLPDFNVEQLDSSEQIPSEELWIAIRSIKRLLDIPELDRGMRLDPDSVTWSAVEQHPRFRKFMSEGMPKTLSPEQIAQEKVALSFVKLASYTKRYVELNPVAMRENTVENLHHDGHKQARRTSKVS